VSHCGSSALSISEEPQSKGCARRGYKGCCHKCLWLRTERSDKLRERLLRRAPEQGLLPAVKPSQATPGCYKAVATRLQGCKALAARMQGCKAAYQRGDELRVAWRRSASCRTPGTRTYCTRRQDGGTGLKGSRRQPDVQKQRTTLGVIRPSRNAKSRAGADKQTAQQTAQQTAPVSCELERLLPDASRWRSAGSLSFFISSFTWRRLRTRVLSTWGRTPAGSKSGGGREGAPSLSWGAQGDTVVKQMLNS